MKKLIYVMLFAALLLPACKNSDEALVEGYNSESPEWEGFVSDIEKQTGEIVESINIPESSTDKNLVFVSTSGKYIGEFPNGKQENKIYSYDIQTKVLTDLYSEEEDRVLKTVGREGDKLVVFFNGIDNNPGPCAPLWTTNFKYGFLSIKDPKAGFSDYALPSDLIEKGKAEEAACQKELQADSL